jgi:hypothetical protein
MWVLQNDLISLLEPHYSNEKPIFVILLLQFLLVFKVLTYALPLLR